MVPWGFDRQVLTSFGLCTKCPLSNDSNDGLFPALYVCTSKPIGIEGPLVGLGDKFECGRAGR